MAGPDDEFFKDVPRGVITKRLQQAQVPQARWMPVSEMLASPLLTYDPVNPGARIMMGHIGDRLFGIEDNRHILTVAGSRTGKSVTVIGNLLFYKGSVLALDPKGELAKITAERRKALGQKICILDPFGVVPEHLAKYRVRFNPLAFLKPDSETIIEDAGLIGDAMVLATEKDPHWDESARSLIEGVILFVASAPQFESRRNLATISQVMRSILRKAPGKEEFILQTAMLDHAARLERLTPLSDLAEAIRGTATDFFEKPQNERASVLSTARRHLRFLDYKALRRVLTDHDFDLSELKTAPQGMTIFLCLPATRLGACSRWLRIFINLLLDAMERTTAVPAAPVLACLDEFPILGHMKQLEDAAGQIASFGVRLWVIVQDWGQGKSLYKDRWETFVGNAGVLQFFGNNDLMTTEYISKKLGKTSVLVVRESDVSAEQRSMGLSGRSESLEQHDLLTPDEISRQFSRNDRLHRQLVIWAGRHPMMMQRAEYYDETSPVYRHFKGLYGKA